MCVLLRVLPMRIKGASVGLAPKIAKTRGLHLAAIQKNNMKDKKIKTEIVGMARLRSPYERVFSERKKEFVIEVFQRTSLQSLCSQFASI